MKVQVAKIIIRRAEGPCSECRTVEVADFPAAEKVLSGWARTAPKGGGYDKCDFTILYEDGQEYKGRYDLTFEREETLAGHMLNWLEWCGGIAKNPWCGPQKYAEIMARSSETEQAEFIEFLNTYYIPEN